MPYAQGNDVKIYYEIHGQGEPLLFINGLKTDHTRWFKLKNLLANRYQMILFDNRATGRTQDAGNEFGVDTMASDAALLIDHIGLDTVSVVGHSLGGATAQSLAYRYPEKVKKLFLLNTFLKLNEAAKKGFFDLLKLHEQGASTAEIIEAMIPWGFSKKFVTPEVKKAILELSEINPYPQSTNDYRRQYQALTGFDSRGWVHEIIASSYIITSEEDVTATPQESEELAGRIKNAKLFRLPGGHASAVEQAEKLADLLTCF